MISIKKLGAELKLDLRKARQCLRSLARDPEKHPELSKMHKPRDPWSWIKGSVGEKEARVLLAQKVVTT